MRTAAESTTAVPTNTLRATGGIAFIHIHSKPVSNGVERELAEIA
jgi:hypothetical protein